MRDYEFLLALLVGLLLVVVLLGKPASAEESYAMSSWSNGSSATARFALVSDGPEGTTELAFHGTAPTPLGAELQALRAAKARLRTMIALVDAAALEHIGEVLP